MVSGEMVFGTDLDGVVSLLPLNLKQAALTPDNEKNLYRLQESRLLQRAFNNFIRKPNPEIRKLMDELRLIGVKSVIISASNINYREELERWLMFKGFCFEDLMLKESFEENGLAYKSRVVPDICDFYLDDKEEIVWAVNNAGNGKCRAVLYRGQTSKELLKELFPVFV